MKWVQLSLYGVWRYIKFHQLRFDDESSRHSHLSRLFICKYNHFIVSHINRDLFYPRNIYLKHHQLNLDDHRWEHDFKIESKAREPTAISLMNCSFNIR